MPRTINPNRTRNLHEALGAAAAARRAGLKMQRCIEIANHCTEQWAKRLEAAHYTCQQHHIDDGLLVWVATGPCGCRFEYAPTADGRTDCLSNSGEHYCIEDHHGMWTCGCEAFDRDGRHCKHLAGWQAVRWTARRTASKKEDESMLHIGRPRAYESHMRASYTLCGQPAGPGRGYSLSPDEAAAARNRGREVCPDCLAAAQCPQGSPAAQETPSAPAPVKSWETPEYHALKAEAAAILG